MNTTTSGTDKCCANNETQQCGKVKRKGADLTRVVKRVFSKEMIFELRQEQ